MTLPDPQLEIVEAAGLSFLTDERLFEECGIRIGFTNRIGGVSEGPFASLNLGVHTEDAIEDVEENRRILWAALGASDTAPVYPKQVHGDAVLEVLGRTDVASVQERADEGADGILVSCTDVATLLCFADCVPVILVSPRSFAVVHAGWRGVMARIAPKAVEMMLSLGEGLSASEINVYIGPHIASECFETSVELAGSFAEAFGDEVRVDPRHVDLSRALIRSLEGVGVVSKRIADTGVCTVCHNEDYFSYRAQEGRCGRHGAFGFRREVPWP